MLFFGKENIFMCLAATKFVLRKINSGVWFIQTFLQKMLYMPNFPHTSSTVNMQIMNQFHTHSQKKQNPTKKFIKSGQIEIAQRRRRWDRVGEARSEARSVRSSDERARQTIAPLVDRDYESPHRSWSSIAPLVERSHQSRLRSHLHHTISSSPPLRDLNLTEFDEFFCWVLLFLWMSVELIHYLHVYSWGSVWKIGHVKHFL